MNGQTLNNSSIEKYHHDLEVIRNAASQIIKDFELFGIEITFSGNEQTAYEELKSQIIPVLINLFCKNYSTFYALLYRIDIDENKVREILMDSSKENPSEELSKLILEREFIKVLFKKFY
ncbi:MAG: hypothetical protein ABI855_03780 [Bacteroidota bacterium]